VLVAMLGLIGCGDAKGQQEAIALQPAKIVPSTTPPAPDTAAPKKDDKKDSKKGDKQDNEWAPAEHKAGMSRWKDTGVYVDGKPVGFLSWGELPIGLSPTWVKDKVSDRKRPGTNDPGWKWARQRFYKFTDYLKAVGIDIRKVKEIHVYGPKLADADRDQGPLQSQSPSASCSVRREHLGKPIPQAPDGFNGKTADKISA
jgi:hypothetical protein